MTPRSSQYGRKLRWRIRKKYWVMKGDLELIGKSGLDIEKHPEKNPKLLKKRSRTMRKKA